MQQMTTYSRRCCFCIPLRKGLLTWGYFKLALLLTCLLAYLAKFMAAYLENPERLAYIMIGSIVFYLVIEIGFTLTLIIGAHVKHCIMLRTYGIFSIINVLFLVADFIFAVTVIVQEEMRHHDFDIYWVLLPVLTSVFMYIVLNIYVSVLVRCEVTKLRDVKEKTGFFNEAADIESLLKVPA